MALVALAMLGGLAISSGAVASSATGATGGAASVQGTASAGGSALAHARVVLSAGSRTGVVRLGSARTDAGGRFSIAYTRPVAGILYLDATAASSPRLRLRAVVGFDGSGAVPATAASTVTVNEFTTVATGFALAQFTDGAGIHGPSPGLQNAAATALVLADPATGQAGSVLSDSDNGSSNESLALVGTLANAISVCARADQSSCAELMDLASQPGETAAADTSAAIVRLAKTPTIDPPGVFAIATAADVYHPALTSAPPAWIVVLLYTDTDLYASGRIAIDARGNVWSSTNWAPGTKDPSPTITAMTPVGQPVFGSPISGGGMKGGSWGAAISPVDGAVWMSSFGGDAISQYAATGAPASPSTGWTNGSPDHPQGLAVDQRGNVWIANNYGPESAPGEGDIVVYPHGDPSKAVTITGGGLNHPFAVQIDGEGRAWVTNAGLGGAQLVGTRAAPLVGKFSGSVTVIGPDFKPVSFSPIQDSSFAWPLGLAIDDQGYAWTVDYFGSTVVRMSPAGAVTNVFHLPKGALPWSEAVDGSGRIWVAGFGTPRVWVVCGSDVSGCPGGSATGAVLSTADGYRSAAFQHFTSVQLDQSGNVWLSNNWSQLDPPVGGTGIAEIVGAATPVCTPLTPLPVRPSSSSSTACPTVRDGASSAVPAAASTAPPWGLWLALGAVVVVLVVGVSALALRRDTPA